MTKLFKFNFSTRLFFNSFQKIFIMERLYKNSTSAFTFLIHRKSFLNYFLLVIVILSITTPASAQVKKNIPPRVYEKVIKPNVTVEIVTVKDGNIVKTTEATLEDTQMPVGSKVVTPYAKRIEIIDTASFRKIKLDPEFKGNREDVKSIPELHIETSEGGTVSYIVKFFHKPFRYDFKQKSFNATLGFFLQPENNTSITNVIEPVHLEIISNVVNIISPDQLIIPHLNLPSSKIQLSGDLLTDSAEVKLITVANPVGYLTYLRVEPALELFTNDSLLQGYGIQTIPVIVRFIGSNSSDAVKVNFSVSNGTVDSTSMYLKYNTPSTIYIQSEGTGEAVLTATTNNLKSNDVKFTYTFP